jgi:S-adenosylmethionine:tRNA ribosyltransferase-isomerase
MLKTSDFDYTLPEGRIASYPANPRDSSRLMALPPDGSVRHETFRALPSFLQPGDVLVLNDSRVIKARLHGRLESGGRAEVFLLEPSGDGYWEAMVRPGKRLREGKRLLLGESGASLEIVGVLEGGNRLVKANGIDWEAALKRYGEVPLPPYIPREAEKEDTRRYQTVYAREGRSVAAPTAGLHFTPRVLQAVRDRGVELIRVRLDVGAGTFKPVTAEDAEGHRMETEHYEVSPESADRLNGALSEGRRIVAVGTTVTRVLEDQAARFGEIRSGVFDTRLFIRPPYRFRAVDLLLTNFHLPKSTLVMLVCALAGMDRILSAYREAVDEGYRFYSFGDAMLVWNSYGTGRKE